MWYGNKLNLKDESVTRTFISKHMLQMQIQNLACLFLWYWDWAAGLWELDGAVCSGPSAALSSLLSHVLSVSSFPSIMSLDLKWLPVLTYLVFPWTWTYLFDFINTGLLSWAMRIKIRRKIILRIKQEKVPEAIMPSILSITQIIINDTAKDKKRWP